MAARLTEAQARRAGERLLALGSDPAARANAAVEFLAMPPSPAVLFPVAEALTQHPLQAARDGLLSAYEAVEAGRRRVDPGGALRAALLKALRPVAVPGDLPLVLRAASTYEVTPNGPAALELRAAAVVALVDLDPEAAGFVAARLLAEAGDPRRTSSLSGEPAVTAARVLGAVARYEPLYLAALLDWSAPAEVVAECIRQLAPAGFPALHSLVERHADAAGEAIHAAMVDLLVTADVPDRGDDPGLVPWLRGVSLDVYQFALASLVASRHPAHHALAVRLVADEYRRDRLAAAAAALVNGRGSETLQKAHLAVRERLDA